MNKVLKVYELNNYIKTILDNDFLLSSLEIEGEISNYKSYPNGHAYFTIKDEHARMNCIYFKWYNIEKKVWTNGQKVIVTANLSMYEKEGNIQLYVKSIRDIGIGNLYADFEFLKQKLADEGLFDESRKKDIPFFPNRVGIITAPSGAAIADMLNIIQRRAPWCSILLYPSFVQGELAAASLINGISYFSKNKDVDVVIIGRGGGSYEDLFAFNDENLARAIASFEIPIISAVGHEIDFTISDFVSDLRAPTPSAAAELVVPDKSELYNILESNYNRLKLLINKKISDKHSKLNKLNLLLHINEPNKKLMNLSINNNILLSKVNTAFANKINSYRSKLDNLKERLDSANLNLLSNSNIKVFSKDEEIVTVSNLENYDIITVKLPDGKIIARVMQIIKEN